jgi:hypothetical protein
MKTRRKARAAPALRLPAAGDHQLVVLDRHAQVVGPKPGHRQRDAQPIFAYILDIIRRVAVAGGLCGAFDEAAGMLEAQKEGAVE